MITSIKSRALDLCTWKDFRHLVIQVAFWTVVICASILAYKTFKQYSILFACCIFAVCVAYDLVLSPQFSNFIHWSNHHVAVFFSIALLLFAGTSTGVFFISSKEDSTLTSLEAQIVSKQMAINDVKGSNNAIVDIASSLASGLNSDKKSLDSDRKAVSKNNSRMEKLQKEYDNLLAKRTSYIESKGGQYKDPQIKIYHSLHNILYKNSSNPPTIDEFAFIIMCITWIAILSIQTRLSAAVHGVMISRPTIMGGIVMLLDFIFGIKKKYHELDRELRDVALKHKTSTRSNSTNQSSSTDKPKKKSWLKRVK